MNGPLSAAVPRSKLPEKETSVSAPGGVGLIAGIASAVNDEVSGEKPSSDAQQDGLDPQDHNRPDGKENETATKGREDEVASEEEDRTIRNILADLRIDTLYPDMSKAKNPLPQRIMKGAKLALQQMEYVRLMEDRMQDMESRLRLIENKGVEPESHTPPSGVGNNPENMIMGIKRMTFQEYLPTEPDQENKLVDVLTTIQHKPRHEFPGQLPYHLIDVVVSGTNQPERLGNDQNTKSTPGPPHPATSGPALPGPDSKATDIPSIQPERIRINSTLLLELLEKITDTRFSFAKIDNKHLLQDQVILRPFKIFVTYEQEIRNEVDRLVKIHHHSSERKSKEPNAAKNESPQPGILPITETSVPLDTAQDSSREHLNSVTDDKPQNVIVDDSVNGVHEEIPPLESKRCLEELLVLRELLDNDLKPIFDLRRQIKDGSARNIAFQDLWHLFPLGSEIVSNGFNDQSQAYRILDTVGGRPYLCNRFDVNMEPLKSYGVGREVPKFDILSFYYGFDGKELGACQQLHTIKSYDGNKAIISLPCFPINYSKQSRGLKPRDFFVERGKRFLELTRNADVVHKRYNGLTLAVDELREEIDSEVIIDVSMAMLKNKVNVVFGVTQNLELDARETLEYLDHKCRVEGCCQNTPIHRDYNMDRTRNAKLLEEKGFMRAFIESDSELTEDDYVVCPCWVYGYVLRSRKWVKLEISLVEDIKESGSGFDSLVLPDGHKETLLALVKSHSQGKKHETGLKAENRQMGLVRGKGKGLIILLHGEPGVGKSSTAESIAEFTGRPLFQVTCSEIGESADEVEKRLENHFQLAHKWSCVLLLDEADVFLEARSKTDLKRNAIVSVFLRVLEYYPGILFLTTNRVGTFDQAFRSRIHMSLFYPRIEEDATIRIWEMNIDRAREIWGDNLSIDEPDRKGILRFASRHYKDLAGSETTWNGRQIRNAFQTAIALAEWDAYQGQLKFKSPVPLKPRLEAEHFERVAQASKHFDAYLKETQVGTMADLASNNRERKDDFPGADS